MGACGGGADTGARALLDELSTRSPDAPAVISEAWLLGALGRSDEAFEVLARADEELDALRCHTGYPAFDSLRADPSSTCCWRDWG